ncbi:hypothetical protein E2C01_081803 [Portunus trituberculatus]|uniref:Uncharacterized protein n=1 Tax=Portunus trituberculatus TaxID=210409 RepID=A0A5B7J235_PORTR|nr:hypothetical protein [Portunus trituberculatus]
MTHNPAPGGGGPSTPLTSQGNAITKVLPVVTEVRAISGTDPEYSAREYINHCKDIMRHVFLTDEADKISFLRLRLQPGSQAAHAMRASAFTEPSENWDYEQFKTNFLETFGDNLKHSLWCLRLRVLKQRRLNFLPLRTLRRQASQKLPSTIASVKDTLRISVLNERRIREKLLPQRDTRIPSKSQYVLKMCLHRAGLLALLRARLTKTVLLTARSMNVMDTRLMIATVWQI